VCCGEVVCVCVCVCAHVCVVVRLCVHVSFEMCLGQLIRKLIVAADLLVFRGKKQTFTKVCFCLYLVSTFYWSTSFSCGSELNDVSVVGLQGVAVRVPVLSLHCMERCDLRMEFKV